MNIFRLKSAEKGEYSAWPEKTTFLYEKRVFNQNGTFLSKR